MLKQKIRHDLCKLQENRDSIEHLINYCEKEVASTSTSDKNIVKEIKYKIHEFRQRLSDLKIDMINQENQVAVLFNYREVIHHINRIMVYIKRIEDSFNSKIYLKNKIKRRNLTRIQHRVIMVKYHLQKVNIHSIGRKVK